MRWFDVRSDKSASRGVSFVAFSGMQRHPLSGSRKSRSRAKRHLACEALEDRHMMATDITMFNDVVAGPTSHANATTFSTNTVSSGFLKDVATGAATAIQLTTTTSGAVFETGGVAPAVGNPAHGIFNGFVDFAAATNSNIAIDGADFYDYTFSGLDAGNSYDFVGTAIRGNPVYFNRWVLITLEGVDGATAAHSAGSGVVTAGLNANQVAIWTGANHQANQGYVAQWTGIDPGDDGEFTVRSEHYRGPTPGLGTGTASGAAGYAITGVRLIEHDINLSVESTLPAVGEVVASAPASIIVNFNRAIDPLSVHATDFLVNGIPATGFTVVDNDTVNFNVSIPGSGDYTMSLVAGSILTPGGIDDPVAAFSGTFTVAGPPSVTNLSPSLLLARSATVGAQVTSTGGTNPSLKIYWGSTDGGTNAAAWQNSVDLGTVAAGSFSTTITGLVEDSDYFYRAFAANPSGSTWASTTSTFSTTPLALPDLSLLPVSEIGAFTAAVRGAVTNTGGDPPQVSIYFGTTDGGTNSQAWERVVPVGEVLDNFSGLLTGLRANTPYFVRAEAINAAGARWSNSSLQFTTDDSPAIVINELMAVNTTALLTRTRTAPNVAFAGNQDSPDWLELRNVSNVAQDIGGLHLTDDPDDLRKWQIPPGTQIPANGFIVFFASGKDVRSTALDERGYMHTNFQLTTEGEYLALTGSDGTIISELGSGYPTQVLNISWGYLNDQARYFTTSTPGAANSTNAVDQVADTRFSVERGFFEQPFDVTITSNTPDAIVRYTLDGSAPSETRGTIYAGPINIAKTSTLRAIAYKPGMLATNVDTQTYLFLNDVVRQTTQTTIASGFPATWNGNTADYGMDPDVVGPNDRFGGVYASTIVEDLKALPTLSIVTEIGGVFGATGIYSNPENASLEVPTSVEFFSADGDEEFQINGGVKIQGGAFRSFGLTRKKSLRLKFKSQYGPEKLEYPLFGENATQEFDTLTLRMDANDGWQWSDAGGQPQYLRDEFHRRTQLAMGQPASHGRHAHVYINGVYWGMYNIVERPDQSFAEAYIGSAKDDWDGINSGEVINADDDAARRTRATNAWNTALQLAASVQSAPNEAAKTAAYMRVQGLNADGTDDPTQPSYIDIDNLIDYLIVNYYGGNSDWPFKNYYFGRENSPDSEGFKFFTWDVEWSLFLRAALTVNRLNDDSGPAVPFQDLRTSAEFRLRFADRVHQHFFNGGVFYVDPNNPTYDPTHPERNVPAARYAAIADEIRRGLVAESARWGDQHRTTNPYTRNLEWTTEFNRIMNDWFPQRSGIMLQQFRGASLYPNIAAPVFNVNGEYQHGGAVTTGDLFSMTLPGGETTTDTVIVSQNAPALAFVPADGSLEVGPGPLWYDTAFVPTNWRSGTNGIGFEDSPAEFAPFIGTDILADWNARESSVYGRINFNVSASTDLAAYERMLLRVRYDDGFVAYLNGVPIASSFTPTTTTWNSVATGSRTDAESIVFQDFNVTNFKSLLRTGDNLLAIHILNSGPTSSDLLAEPELVLQDVTSVNNLPVYYTTDGTDPRALGGAIRGQAYTGSIPLTQSTQIRARAFSNGQWSALNETTFVVQPPELGDIVISEINYNPAEPTLEERNVSLDLDNDDFEFIELTNRGTQAVDLLGLTFTSGIQFTFGSQPVAPGGRVVVVRDANAFALRYPGVAIAGQFVSGSLSNGGETLALADREGHLLASFEYSDGSLWPAAADGPGASLELIDPAATPATELETAYRWRASVSWGGSPGTAGHDLLGVRITEVLSNSDGAAGRVDAVELHNASNQSVNLSGAYLSDSATDLVKFQIPLGTILAPGAYRVFDESDFNPNPAAPGPDDFAINGDRGESLWLVMADASGRVTSFIDTVHFDGTSVNTSLGRTSVLGELLVPNSRLTLGCINGLPLVDGPVISEVQYNPGEPNAAALAAAPNLTEDDLEFIEIHNPNRTAVSLTNWRVRGGVDFDLPAGTQLGPGQILVLISFDPQAPINATRLAGFRAHYGIGQQAGIVFAGGWQGQLSDTGELVELQRPLTPSDEEPTFIPHMVADVVAYDDLVPWDSLADGSGESLQRLLPTMFASNAVSWYTQLGTPGTLLPVDVSVGDVDGSAAIDSHDIDLIYAAIRRGSTNASFDLNQDSVVDAADVRHLVENIVDSAFGDANLDGVVDGSDFNRWNAWKFTSCGGSWGAGDFNGDGTADGSDLNIWLTNRFRAPGLAETPQRRVPRAPLAVSPVIPLVASAMTSSRPISRDETIVKLGGNGVTNNERADDQRFDAGHRFGLTSVRRREGTGQRAVPLVVRRSESIELNRRLSDEVSSVAPSVDAVLASWPNQGQ